MNTCAAVISIPSHYREETTGKGFSKRTVCLYRCPQCGTEHRSRKNWHGPTPRGGFLCGAPIKTTGERITNDQYLGGACV